MASSHDSETTRLADQLERSLRGGAWHGPAIAEAFADLDAEDTARRPLPGAHSVREIVNHVAFCLDEARRRIQGEPEQGPEEDWPVTPGEPELDWKQSLERLEDAHRALRTTLLGLDDQRLDAPVAGSDPTVRGMLLGLLQHNAYHAGQILLIGRAARRERS